MGLAKRIKRVKYGLDTPSEFVLAAIDKACLSVFGKYRGLSAHAAVSRLRKKYRTKDCYQIKDARLPLLEGEDEVGFFVGVFSDTFTSYVYFDDVYTDEMVDLYDSLTQEGCYGLVNDKVNVTVEPGDVVIDAGSWLGDFAAYASARCKNLGGYRLSTHSNRWKKLTNSCSKQQNSTRISYL